REDIGDGDVTTDFFVDKNRQATARIVARERAILAGVETAAEVFRRVDPAIEIAIFRKDGSELNAGDSAIELRAAARSILKAVRKVREARPNVQIEVEADTLEQVHALLEIDGIDVIMLDNMKPAQIREAVALGKDKVRLEASGGVTLKNIRQIAATGVDYISIGALTHSARAIDLSLEMTPTVA